MIITGEKSHKNKKIEKSPKYPWVNIISDNSRYKGCLTSGYSWICKISRDNNYYEIKILTILGIIVKCNNIIW